MADPAYLAKAVELTRLTRDHPDLRIGSSVRGSIDLVLVASSLAQLRGVRATDLGVSLDAALVALSGRVRVREGAATTSDAIIKELWERVFAHRPEELPQGK
jgi:MoxR-like ATPase